MTWLPDRIYRTDRQRESVWEALDAMPPGREFTLHQLWRQNGVTATYSMVCTVARDAIARRSAASPQETHADRTGCA